MPLDRCALGHLAMFLYLLPICLYFLGTFFYYDLMLRSTITNYEFQCSYSTMILCFCFCFCFLFFFSLHLVSINISALGLPRGFNPMPPY
jgi:hypothetical protein